MSFPNEQSNPAGAIPVWVTEQASPNHGIGALTAVPAGSTNGTIVGTKPAAAVGLRFYLGASDSITMTIALSAPVSAPAVTYTILGSATANWDESLGNTAMIYITAIAGSPKFRWY
ncbi:MAG: hypothetical protein ACEQSH_00165 [Bacteroidia bacterium]